MMPTSVADRINYHFEALKISDEMSDYAELMNKRRNYKPPGHLGESRTVEVK